jgi:hypothetical protein
VKREIVELGGERRGTERRQAVRPALIKQPRLRPPAIRLNDISSHGCGFTAACDFAPAARVLLDLPGLEVWSAAVAWWHDGRGGLSFTRPMHPAVAERLAARGGWYGFGSLPIPAAVFLI